MGFAPEAKGATKNSPGMLACGLMNILVIEDDAEIASFVTRGLRRGGYEVDRAADGENGLRMALGAGYDTAIVDLMLPGLDGLSLIEQLRAAGIKTPVIVLSARRSTDDKVACLRRGADDYLAKPFDLPELLARVEALLRRTQPAGELERIEAAGVVVDLINRTVRRDGRVASSSRRASLHSLSCSCATKGGRYRRVTSSSGSGTIALRRRRISWTCSSAGCATKSTRISKPKLIHTVRGIGYVFRQL